VFRRWGNTTENRGKRKAICGCARDKYQNGRKEASSSRKRTKMELLFHENEERLTTLKNLKELDPILFRITKNSKMNSKQINFFLKESELVDIKNFFDEEGCLVSKRRCKNLSPNENYDFVSNADQTFQVYVYLPKYINKIKLELVEEKGYYYIDSLTSYCIEFGLGGFYPYSDKEFHRSKFYFVTKYYDIIKKK
jgi:hypothetical protein